MKDMEKAKQILSKYPSVKIGMDDHYGKQTVLNAINEALTTNPWIKVSERLPEIDGEYLVTLNNKTVTNLNFSQFVIGKWFHLYSDAWTNEINPVTHWMPKPTAPKD